jgi:magnesium transporter
MITAYLNQSSFDLQEITSVNQILLKKAVWVDLLSPTKDEENLVEQNLALNIPTRDEMIEIELSSRLYKYNNNLFMTTIMIAESDSPEPKLDPVTFVLTEQQLITVRYIEPQAFKLTVSHLKKSHVSEHTATELLFEILESSVDRLADILELVGRRMDECSKAIFHSQTDTSVKTDYKLLMQLVGANGDLNTKARESLLTFNRLITFFGQNGIAINPEQQLHIISLGKDISSLSDQANFLSTKVNFLLDAILGMVNIEQNNIIKIFSVAAVIFLPPTLIASIYGMNFKIMPELSWRFGYLFAVGMILLAAWLPYRYFKYRKWL